MWQKLWVIAVDMEGDTVIGLMDTVRVTEGDMVVGSEVVMVGDMVMVDIVVVTVDMAAAMGEAMVGTEEDMVVVTEVGMEDTVGMYQDLMVYQFQLKPLSFSHG